MTNQRTTTGLRDILFDEIDHLRSINGDPQRAQAVGRLAREIIGTARLEMEFHRLGNALGKDADAILKPVALGSLSPAAAAASLATAPSCGMTAATGESILS